jgi:sRNA-binding carbon storage regulator CsrA
MLVLTRRRAERTFIDFSGMTDAELLALRLNGPIRMTVVEIKGDKVRLGFDAPDPVKVHREEVFGNKKPEA